MDNKTAPPEYTAPPAGQQVQFAPQHAPQNASQSQLQQAPQPAQTSPATGEPGDLSPWQEIMTTGFYDCCADCIVCSNAYLYPHSLFAQIYALTDQGSTCEGWCCYCCVCGTSRSQVQRLLGVRDEGCCKGCCVHTWCPCCALAQEFRAVTLWVQAGKPMAAAAVPGEIAMMPTGASALGNAENKGQFNSQNQDQTQSQGQGDAVDTAHVVVVTAPESTGAQESQ